MTGRMGKLLAVVVSSGLIAAGCAAWFTVDDRNLTPTPAGSATTAPPIASPTPAPKPTTVKLVPGPKFPSQRYQFGATQLADGRILLVGGYLPADQERACKGVKIVNGACVGPASASAEIFDPVAGTFTPTGSMSTPRRGHGSVLLRDGRVLVVGGLDWVGLPLGTAEVWDPATGKFTSLGKLNQDTSGDAPPMFSPEPSNVWRMHMLLDQTITVLSDGRVLIAGGQDSLGDSSNAATIFDPKTNAFTNLPGMPLRWQNASAALLRDGKVLLVGGIDSTTYQTSADALLFDPATNSFSKIGPALVARKGASQTVLPDGRVFISGGMVDPNNMQPNCGTVIPAEIYTPATGKFAAASSTRPTWGEWPVLIPDGRVLLLGGLAGDQDCTSLNQVEAFDPGTGAISLLARGILPEGSIAAAFTLADGSVFLFYQLLGDGGAVTLALSLE